jgi:hypothetical protein
MNLSEHGQNTPHHLLTSNLNIMSQLGGESLSKLKRNRCVVTFCWLAAGVCNMAVIIIIKENTEKPHICFFGSLKILVETFF